MKKKWMAVVMGFILGMTAFPALVPAAQEDVRSLSVSAAQEEDVTVQSLTDSSYEAQEAGDLKDPEEGRDAVTSGQEEPRTDTEDLENRTETEAGEVALSTLEDAVTLAALDRASGSFTVKIDRAAAVYGGPVVLPVWCAKDQSDIVWYTAKEEADGWTVTGNIAKHQFHSGLYYADAYQNSDSGMRYLGGTTFEMQMPESGVTAQVNENQSAVSVYVRPGGYGDSLAVSFALWSDADGQDDLIWYTPQKTGELVYSANVRLADHKGYGKYYADAYGRNAAGQMIYLGGATFEITKASAGKVTVSDVDPATGNFTVTIPQVKAPSGLQYITVPVWSKKDQSDLHWYMAEKSGDVYVARCSLSNHGYHTGTYLIDVYVANESGRMECIASVRKEVKAGYSDFSAQDDERDETTWHIRLSDLTTFGQEVTVQFPIWSEAGGQDDLKWYSADFKNGSYQVDFDLINHMTAGKYFVDAYAKLKDGTMLYIGGITFNVAEVPREKTRILNIDQNAGTFDIEVTVLRKADEYQGVVIPTWSQNDQSDIVWYTPKRQTNSTWLVHADIVNHDTNVGVYKADAYIRENDGSLSYLGGAKAGIALVNYVVTNQISECLIRITIYGPQAGGLPANYVSFPTWSEAGGQDDIVWHTGVPDEEDGSFTATIYRSEHSSDGVYVTDIYPANELYQEAVRRVTYEMWIPTDYTDYASDVMCNIIFAVETGGQVYGNARYDCFAQAYKNTPNETAITIGAGGWFANEAKRLLNRIRTADPATFARLDTAGIGKDLDNENWQYYGTDGKGNVTIEPGSAKALCIQRLISSDAGIREQQKLLAEQMAAYVNEAAGYGVTDLKARMFMANVRHLGGLSAMKRVINNCIADGKALTMENLWQAMLDHDSQAKDATQVGSPLFHSRHKKVMTWLNKYIG